MAEPHARLAELLEVSPRSLQAETLLAELDGWNSITALEFLIVADAEFGVLLGADELMDAHTIGDLLRMIDAGQSGRAAA